MYTSKMLKNMDYQKLLKYIPEPIVVVSPAYRVLAATNEYLRVTMRTEEELLGQHILEAFPDNPDSDESKNERLLRESLDRALKSKRVDYLDVLRYDIPRPAAQGGGFDIRFWEASHTPVLDKEGEVEFIIQRTSDVTEREIAKLALSESEDKFRFMAEAMPQLIFTANAAGKLTYFNQRWVQYTGIPIKELLNSGWEKVIHPEDLAGSKTKSDEALASGRELQLELRKRDKDGSYRWHLCRMLPMRNEENEIVMWIGSSTDIHDTRQMVQELLESNEQMALLSDQVQQAYKEAEKERKTLERLFMESPAFFCMLKGPEHRFELINQNYQKIFPQRELLHKTVEEALPEVVEQGFIELLDKVYNTGETFIAEETPIRLDRYSTGKLEELYLSFSYQALYDEEGHIMGVLVFGYDVTEQVRYRQKLEELGHGLARQA